MKKFNINVAYFIILSILTFIATPVYAEPAYESSATLRASEILSPIIVKGPHHQVDESVLNDAYLNVYTIHSEYGDVQAVSTAKLMKYIAEINAVAEMKKIQRSDEFVNGMKDKAGAVVEGARDLITDPVGAVGNTLTGVGKLFSRSGEIVFGGSRSDTEDGRMESLLGYAKAKRDIAYSFGIDVYSHNEILQKELDELSSADGTGTLVMSGLLMAVPGGAGVAVSVTGGTNLMDRVIRDSAPADLRKTNRAKLEAIGVNKDVADLFIANGVYTPSEQTYLVSSIDSMGNTSGRDKFIKFATLANDPDTAFFRQRQAMMYAAYNAKVQHIASFITFGNFTTGRTTNGNIIFNVPLDHLLWTKDISGIIKSITQEVSSMEEIKDRYLFVSGTTSDLARESLQEMGWKVQENADTKLF